MATTWQTAKQLRAHGNFTCTLCGGTLSSDADDVEWFGSDGFGQNEVFGHGVCDVIEAKMRHPEAARALAEFFVSLGIEPASHERAGMILARLIDDKSFGTELGPEMRPVR